MARSRPPPRRTRNRWWRPRKNPAAGLTGSRKVAGAVAGLMLLTAAGSAPSRAAPPKPAATSSQVFQFALQNGMQVLVIPDHRAPVVTQMLWFKVGGVDDPPGVSGLAHFFEHMMFRGTKAVKGDEYSKTIAKNGGDENAGRIVH